MSVKRPRPWLFNVRLNAHEKARLTKVSEHYGLNGAQLIRFLLKREENQIQAKDKDHE